MSATDLRGGPGPGGKVCVVEAPGVRGVVWCGMCFGVVFVLCGVGAPVFVLWRCGRGVGRVWVGATEAGCVGAAGPPPSLRRAWCVGHALQGADCGGGGCCWGPATAGGGGRCVWAGRPASRGVGISGHGRPGGAGVRGPLRGVDREDELPVPGGPRPAPNRGWGVGVCPCGEGLCRVCVWCVCWWVWFSSVALSSSRLRSPISGGVVCSPPSLFLPFRAPSLVRWGPVLCGRLQTTPRCGVRYFSPVLGPSEATHFHFLRGMVFSAVGSVFLLFCGFRVVLAADLFLLLVLSFPAVVPPYFIIQGGAYCGFLAPFYLLPSCTHIIPLLVYEPSTRLFE